MTDNEERNGLLEAAVAEYRRTLRPGDSPPAITALDRCEAERTAKLHAASGKRGGWHAGINAVGDALKGPTE